jgi:predicted Rossmann fold nucleotide-binding protein DprA/Smf involved in DNA uptake
VSKGELFLEPPREVYKSAAERRAAFLQACYTAFRVLDASTDEQLEWISTISDDIAKDMERTRLNELEATVQHLPYHPRDTSEHRRVLAVIAAGPSNMLEISRQAGTNHERTGAILSQFERQGRIEKTGSHSTRRYAYKQDWKLP